MITSEELEQKKRDTLYDLADKYVSEKPQLMVPQFAMMVVGEAYQTIRQENQELKKKIEELTKVGTA